jgi:tetratricopeptide (TPR) repeat protein
MAAEYLQHGKATEAAMSLETALRLQPSNAEALRLLARLKGSTGEGPKSLENWRKLAEGGSLTLEDLSLYAAAAAGENEWELAERIADTAATGGNPALRHLLRAELLTSKKDLPGAEAELRLAVDADKTGKARIALARFLMTHRFNAETAPEMLELLREVSKLQDERGVDAIATAMRIGVVPPAELPIWINALREHPKVNARTLFLADTVEWQSNPASKPAVLERITRPEPKGGIGVRTPGSRKREKATAWAPSERTRKAVNLRPIRDGALQFMVGSRLSATPILPKVHFAPRNPKAVRPPRALSHDRPGSPPPPSAPISPTDPSQPATSQDRWCGR